MYTLTVTSCAVCFFGIDRYVAFSFASFSSISHAHCNTVGTVARTQDHLHRFHVRLTDPPMPLDDNFAVSGTSGVDQDCSEGRHLRAPSQRAQVTHLHPHIQSLVAKHCEQLSSGLLDVFRTEIEEEVKERVSVVLVSKGYEYLEELRLEESARRAAEIRCRELEQQLELSNQRCSQLLERIRKLEATEVEPGNPVLQAGVTPPLLSNQHLILVYERAGNRMLCRICLGCQASANGAFEGDVKPSTLEKHIQDEHPDEYNTLVNTEEKDLRRVVEEMDRVGDRAP